MGDGLFDISGDKTAVTQNSELVRRFAGWEPRVRKIIDLAGQVRSLVLSPIPCSNREKVVQPADAGAARKY